jgi:hypothetical protein
MSGSATKATNRAIRRAFGSDALDTIDRQGKALLAQQREIDSLKLQVEGLANALAHLAGELSVDT